MAHIRNSWDNSASALARIAQPVIIALSTAGLTGGAMAAAGLLAAQITRRG